MKQVGVALIALFRRTLDRLVRAAVSRLRLPPGLFGFRCIRAISPRVYILQTTGRRLGFSGTLNMIESRAVSSVPLPCNLSSRDRLSRSPGKWGFSFYDVPDRRMEETFVATVPDCRILSFVDQWGDESYAIVTGDNRDLRVRGTAYVREHVHLLRHGAPAQSIEKGRWILEQWDRNYSHWLQWHLPKIALLQDLGMADGIILPRKNRLFSVVDASIQRLGLDSAALPVFESEILHVGELTVVGMDDYRPSLLARVRERMSKPGKRRGRKVYVSRAKALWRRVENEDECWAVLEDHGYENVCMEDMSLGEQISLMEETAVILSVHGTGLANMLFAPAGCHVVEVCDPAFPNPQFYALAGALEHRYWLLEGRPVGPSRPGYNNISVDPGMLEQTVRRVDSFMVA